MKISNILVPLAVFLCASSSFADWLEALAEHPRCNTTKLALDKTSHYSMEELNKRLITAACCCNFDAVREHLDRGANAYSLTLLSIEHRGCEPNPDLSEILMGKGASFSTAKLTGTFMQRCLDDAYLRAEVSDEIGKYRQELYVQFLGYVSEITSCSDWVLLEHFIHEGYISTGFIESVEAVNPHDPSDGFFYLSPRLVTTSPHNIYCEFVKLKVKEGLGATYLIKDPDFEEMSQDLSYNVWVHFRNLAKQAHLLEAIGVANASIILFYVLFSPRPTPSAPFIFNPPLLRGESGRSAPAA